MTRRRVCAGVIGLAALAVLALGGCKPDNTPTEYDTLTKQNFLETCTNFYFENTDDTLAITTNTVKADVTPLTQSQCECQYQVFVDNMPINAQTAKTEPGYSGPNFTDLNAELKRDPTKAWNSVSDDLKGKLQACASGEGSSSGGSGESTTTTAAPAGTSTTGA